MNGDDEKARACLEDIHRVAPQKVIVFSNRIKQAVSLGQEMHNKGVTCSVLSRPGSGRVAGLRGRRVGVRTCQRNAHDPGIAWDWTIP